MKKKVLVSGVQSSGRLHIGNYFGAIKQNIDLGNSGQYEPYVFIADYHSMTSLFDANSRLANTFDAACVYLACGLDPEQVTFFKQSDVPEHTELSWILNTVTPMPMLMLAHSFKDKQEISKYDDYSFENEVLKSTLEKLNADTNGNVNININDFLDSYKEFVEKRAFSDDEAIILKQKIEENKLSQRFGKINSGLFTYPVLMAADILMYNAEVVPVGRDQEQHLEITRELAGKYNRAYGVEQFVMPKAHIVSDVATVPGIDGRKMSKSYDNHIPLFGTPEEIKKRVMSIVTDSARPEEPKSPDENNIYQIHKLFLTGEEDQALRAKFENGGYGYKDAKEALLQAILDFTAPMREKYEYYQANPKEVERILDQGAQKARARAQATMKKIKQQTGLSQ
jgi:tryptophanyl-tRNA synthetase